MKINLLVEDKYRVVDNKKFDGIIRRTLELLNIGKDVTVDLAIVNDNEIRKYNKAYRSIDKATDVLSFPFWKKQRKDSFVVPDQKKKIIGQIIISYPRAVIQAKEKKLPVSRELTILFIHGLLHLLGHDHKKPKQKEMMISLEKQILKN